MDWLYPGNGPLNSEYWLNINVFISRVLFHIRGGCYYFALLGIGKEMLYTTKGELDGCGVEIVVDSMISFHIHYHSETHTTRAIIRTTGPVICTTNISLCF